MNRNNAYNQFNERDEQEQYRRSRENEMPRGPHDSWHPNRIDYRNDEYEKYRGAYRLDNSPENRERYSRLNQENYGYDYSYGHPGNSRNGADRGRHQSDYGNGATYGASRNAGSMGSYGGAQGYGSSRGGYNNGNERWASGHHEGSYQPERRLYGAYRDSNSFAEGERRNYDGSNRYGSQGADNTRGWRRTEQQEQNQSRYNRFSNEDDARYEIYDTSESQYNRGSYNMPPQSGITETLNLRSHQDYPPAERYGSRQRSRYRQGSGYDQDRFSGTSDMEYGNTATPFEQEAYPKNRYYDPLTGNAWNPGA